MLLLLCTHTVYFHCGKGDVFFRPGLFKAIAAYGHKEKKRCLSAQEMNQFASMNHRSVSQNSASICSCSWPFVARISLAVCCLTHVALNSEGARVCQNIVHQYILQDVDLVSNEQSLSVDQDWNLFKNHHSKSLLLSNKKSNLAICLPSLLCLWNYRLLLLERSSQLIIQLKNYGNGDDEGEKGQTDDKQDEEEKRLFWCVLCSAAPGSDCI